MAKFRKIAAKAEKITVALTVTLSLILPTTTFAQNAAQAQTDVDTVEELRNTIRQVESLPRGTPEAKDQLTKALITANELLIKSEEIMLRIKKELRELTDANGNPRNRSDRNRINELRHRAQILSIVVSDLAQFIGRHGGEIHATFFVDPNKGPSEENIRSARISLPAIPLTEADFEDSNRQKHRLRSIVNKVGGAAVNFSNQYFAYSIATGIIAMSQLQFADTSNPNALELWIQQTTDIMGAAGFMIFMAANHKMIHLLNRIKSKRLPRSMIPYLGMAAGSFAQSYFHDLWVDKDLWKCLRSYYDSKAQPNPAACDKAKRTWIAGQHAKILQYAPTVISMIGSAALAGAVRSALLASGGPQALKQGYMKVVAKGVRLFSKAQWARRATILASGLPGVVVTIGDFVLFIALDAHVLHEPVNQLWQNMRMNYFDPQAFLDNRLGLHSEVLFPRENTYQLIDNAFDVEATNLRSAHEYFMETLELMGQSGWQRPPETRTCAPKEIAEGIESGKLKQLKDIWFFQRLYSRQKSAQQLRCEIFSRPADLFERYASVNREWRSVLLNHYSIGQSNWLNFIDRFSKLYEASYLLAKHLAKLKFEMVENGVSERPDLSRETLAKVINAPLSTDSPDEERPEAAHASKLEKTAIPTPELIDYVIASFACGPKPNASVVGNSVNLKTPYGSNPKFLPPKLTNADYSICVVNPYNGKTRNPFDGFFIDWKNNRKVYNSLAEYVFDHLDPELYQKIGINFSFENWWTQNIREPVAPVWAAYEDAYAQFIAESYVPVLFDRSLKHNSGKSENAYRVAHGIFLSLELEVRNYLRALFSIYSSAISGTDDVENKKSAYRALANKLIDQIKEIDAELLNSEAYTEIVIETEATLEMLLLLVEGEILSSEGPNTDFQLEMASEIRKLLSKIHLEILQYASSFHALKFVDGSSAREHAKKLNSDNGSFGNNRPVTLPHNRHGN